MQVMNGYNLAMKYCCATSLKGVMAASTLHRQQGAALIVAVFILVVLSLLAGAMISLQKAGDEVVAREVIATRALLAAETGAHRMLNELFVNGNACAVPSWSVWDFDADSSTGVGLDNCQVSVFCTQLEPASGGTFYEIEAEGQCGYGAEADDSAVRIVRMQAKL